MENQTSHQQPYQPIPNSEPPFPPLPPRPYQHQKQNNPTISKMVKPISTLMQKLSPPPLDEESQKAAKVLRTFCGEHSPTSSSSDTIPAEIIHSAVGLAIFTTTRASTLASLSYGSGVLVARRPKESGGGWSSPSAIMVNSLGMGVMAGVEIYEYVLVINTREALARFEKARVSLGGDVGVSAGPWSVGSRVEVGSGGKGVYSYVRCTKGVYAGFQLDGTIISSRDEENARFYSERVGVEQILRGEVGRWTVLHDTLWEIDWRRLVRKQDQFDEKKVENVGRFPVIMEFNDRRGQKKGKDGVWKSQDEPEHRPRPTRLSMEEWKRGKVYSEILDDEKKASRPSSLHDQPKTEVHFAPNPKVALMHGALEGVPPVSSKEDMYGAHEKKNDRALGSNVLSKNDSTKQSHNMPNETTPLVFKKEYVGDEKRNGGFYDLTYRSGLSSSRTRKSTKEKKKEELIVMQDDKNDDGEWEDERLFYDLNSKSGSAREEWEDERLFYVDVPSKSTREDGEWEDERGFYTIARLEDGGEGERGRGLKKGTKEKVKEGGVVEGGKRDSVWGRAERYA